MKNCTMAWGVFVYVMMIEKYTAMAMMAKITAVVCAVVGMVTGSSWTTAGTLGVAFIGGVELTQGIAGLLMLLVTAEGVALVATFWGLGIVFKFRTQRSGALVQVGVFVAMFLSVGQVPLGIMQGWLHAVARVNPMTNILRMARQGFVAEITWANTWPGLVVILVGSAFFGAWAYAGLRKLNQ